MNKEITSIIMAAVLTLSGLGLTGCTTTGNIEQDKARQRRIETGVQVAAQIGGAIILTENPELRDGFVRAIEDLQIIADGTNNVGIADVLNVVYRLDIDALKSPEAVLYVSSGILILNEFGAPTELNVEQSNSVRGVARALSQGLKVAVKTVRVPETTTPKLPPITPAPPLPPGA